VKEEAAIHGEIYNEIASSLEPLAMTRLGLCGGLRVVKERAKGSNLKPLLAHRQLLLEERSS